MICGSVDSKSRLAKAAGAQSPVQMRNEKLHAAVARSTSVSQNVQNTPGTADVKLLREVHFQVKMYKNHVRTIFWNCGCQKIAGIGKSKCAKHTILSPLLELRMSKNGTPLWREVHFQVKMYKT